MTSIRNKDIRRLDIAMHDALGMRRVQGVGDLDAQREDGFQLHRAGGDVMLERRTFQVLHGDESFAVLLANVVDGADVGMIEGRRGLGLALETSQRLRFAGHLVGQEFQRNEAVQAGVLGFVDNAHATAAKLFQDGVMRDFLADHVSRILARVSKSTRVMLNCAEGYSS